MLSANEDFVPPPECPVFEPTWDEFKDTMSYIQKIRAVGEKSGICKIRPPREWQPPFVIDMDNFKFTPRIQKLNELEAQSRVKILFLNGLAKFWDLQGTQLKIPMVDRKYLDLYKLQKVVREEGGFVLVCNERKWARVANRMNYAPGRGISSTLRSHYERILYPYDLFQSGFTVDSSQPKSEIKPDDEEDSKMTAIDNMSNEAEITKDSKQTTPIKQESTYETRRSTRMVRSVSSKSGGDLSPTGPSPVSHNVSDQKKKEVEVSHSSPVKDEKKKGNSNPDAYFCEMCCRGDNENRLLLCDGCDDAYHTFCLLPPLNEVPPGDWRCPKCVAKECHKPVEAYGFEQAEREYTLESFGEMADKFKMRHFKMPAHLVPTAAVEREFWRLVSCLDEDVIVEYGADIHAAERGSGFPTAKNQTAVDDQNRMYIESGWNLNNLPVLPTSVLQYISADISGMKVPWCYVGMCFTSFSWHTEDHWSYSVNYMHWGEPKTWYGVPGAKAELLEECMKKIAPELFEHSPDLLHQLTTILNPNVLMAYGVPITRTDQHAGEFIITFPRSYHGGFNQGFNFAEAVNFCPADWLPFGRASVDHYKQLHRQCVFSNDELMCKMASVAESLDVFLAGMIYEDLGLVFEEEKRQRKSLVTRGFTNLEKLSFEVLQDDERQCDYCKTTCFLSSVSCLCTPNRMVCLDHVDHLCRCKYYERRLHYELTEDELDHLLSRVRSRSVALDQWKTVASRTLLPPDGKSQKPDLSELKNLIHEAVHQKLPDSDELRLLRSIVSDGEKLQALVNQLTGNKIRTRQRGSSISKYSCRLKVDDLRSLCQSLEKLQCDLKDVGTLTDLVKSTEAFVEDCKKVFDAADLPKSTVVEDLLSRSAELHGLDLEEIPKLNKMLQQTKWLEDVHAALEDRSALSVGDISQLIDSGTNLHPHSSCEAAMAELQKLLTSCQEMEQTASLWLKQWKEAGCKMDREGVDELLAKAAELETYLPGIESLKDYVGKADAWKNKATALIDCAHLPHLDELEGLVNKGAQIPLSMELLDRFDQKLMDARSWQLNIAETLRAGPCQVSVLQRLLKQFKHQRSPPNNQDYKTCLGQSCSMLEEFFAIRSVTRRELEKLRKQNSERLAVEPGAYPDCSICKKQIAKFQRKCPVCLNACHAKCLSYKCSIDGKSRCVVACPSCRVSDRPKLETIESLVASYCALGICLPVGEALSSLLSQSSQWHVAASEALRSEELATALRVLDGNGDSGSSVDCRKSSCNEMTYGDTAVLPEEEEDVSDELNSVAAAEHTYSTSTLHDGGGDFVNGCSSRSSEKKPTRRRLYPVVNLSEKSRTLLDELLVTGWILDVDMEEIINISRIVFACQERQKRKRKSTATSDVADKPLSKAAKLEPPKAILSSCSLSKETRSGEVIHSSGCSSSSISSRDESSMVTETVTCRTKHKSQTSRKAQKPTRLEKFSKNLASSESESDTDELCSADKCQRPTARKVNWVQCDRCLLWFHLLCIGQTMNQITREKDYVCAKCSSRDSPTAGHTTVLTAGVSKSPVLNCPSIETESEMSSVIVDTVILSTTCLDTLMPAVTLGH